MAGAGKRILVAGAGDVGLRFALLRAAAGDEVITLRRSPLEAMGGVRSLRADLLSGEGLHALPGDIDAVVFAAAPDRRDEDAYRSLFVDGQRRLRDALDAPPSRWVFVSSTAVYAEDAGGRVDESSPTRPTAFNGRVLLEAERTLETLSPGACALRFSGLYGPGRDALIRRAISDQPPRPRWTNRIHVDDAASALSRLLDIDSLATCYLGSDDVPAREDAVHDWIRELRGLPALPVLDEPVSGRRVDNAWLRSTGWVPRYADFRAGYGPLVQDAS